MFKGQTTATTDVVSKCIMPVTGAFVSPLRIGRERTREGGRIVILHSTGRTGINTRVVAVLLYGALMRRKVAGDSADVVSGALERGVEVPGVGVGASTGCARIAFAGPNPIRHVAIHDAVHCIEFFFFLESTLFSALATEINNYRE